MKTALAIASLLLLAAAARADNFRCGKWLATPDLPVADLLARCGEPAKRETRIEDVMARNRYSGLMHKTGEVTIETWTYERGGGASPMIVTIVEGRIRSIERRGPA